MSDYTPAGESSFYLLDGTTFVRYDRATNMYTTLAAPPVSAPNWSGQARIGNALWVIVSGQVLKYDIPTDTWTQVVASGVHPNGSAMTVHDASGKIYTFTNATPGGEVAIYDTVAGGSVTYVAVAILNASVTYLEPRLAFDDSKNLLFIAPNFQLPNLYSFNPATNAVVGLANNPGGQMNDAFCADRQGHLYAGGTTNAADPNFYTYDIASNAWKNMPALPFGHGNDGACTVMAGDGGYLYMVQGDSGNNAARIRLQ